MKSNGRTQVPQIRSNRRWYTIIETLKALLGGFLLYGTALLAIVIALFFWYILLHHTKYYSTAIGCLLAIATGAFVYLLAFWMSTHLDGRVKLIESSLAIFLSDADSSGVRLQAQRATAIWDFEAQRFLGTLEKSVLLRLLLRFANNYSYRVLHDSLHGI